MSRVCRAAVFVVASTAVGCAVETEDLGSGDEDIGTETLALSDSQYLRCWELESWFGNYPYYYYFYPYNGESIVPSYYLERYGDLQAAFGGNESSACQHYRDHGADEFRQASPAFNPWYYLVNNPDVAAAYEWSSRGAGDHWRAYGMQEGRRGSAEFHPFWYFQANPDVAEAYGSYGYLGAVFHWLDYGRAQGRPGAP